MTGVAAAVLAASAFTGVAAAQATPTPTGVWSLTDTYDNVPADSPYRTGYDTVTFTPTSPGVYTITNAGANGGGSSGVPVSGDSFMYEVCGASSGGAIYPEGDCPAGSGYFKESWEFDYTGSTYTATGSFQQYAADGSTDDLQYGTFTATGPASSTPDFTISGTLTSHNCSDTSCAATPKPVPDVTVDVASTDGGGTSTSDVSDPNGDWSVDVPDGDYTVTPDASAHSWSPNSQKVKIDGADFDDVDFGTCGSDGETSDLRSSDLNDQPTGSLHCTTTGVKCGNEFQPDPVPCLVAVKDLTRSKPSPPTGSVQVLAYPMSRGPSSIFALQKTFPLSPVSSRSTNGSVAAVSIASGNSLVSGTWVVKATYLPSGNFKPSDKPGQTTFVYHPEYIPKVTLKQRLHQDGVEIQALGISGGMLAWALAKRYAALAANPATAPEAAVEAAATGEAAGSVAGFLAFFTGIGWMEDWASGFFSDPPDPAYSVVVVPHVPPTPNVVAPGDSALSRELRAYVTSELRFRANETALVTTINRGDTAGKAGDSVARTAQVKAAIKEVDQIIAQMKKEITIERKLHRLIGHAYFSNLAGPRRRTDMPSAVIRVLRRLGMPRGRITSLERSASKLRVPAKIDLAKLTTVTKLIIQQKALIAALRKFAENPAPGAYPTVGFFP